MNSLFAGQIAIISKVKLIVTVTYLLDQVMYSIKMYSYTALFHTLDSTISHKISSTLQ